MVMIETALIKKDMIAEDLIKKVSMKQQGHVMMKRAMTKKVIIKKGLMRMEHIRKQGRLMIQKDLICMV